MYAIPWFSTVFVYAPISEDTVTSLWRVWLLEGSHKVRFEGKLIKIHEITIGAYSVKNVVAYVETLETANMSLLGIQFMKKFSEVQWSLNSDELVFYK